MSELVKAGHSGARELSDAELMQVQGGFLGDAWDWVKDKVEDAADAVVHAVTHPVETLGKIARAIDWIGRRYPREPYPRPYPGGGY